MKKNTLKGYGNIYRTEQVHATQDALRVELKFNFSDYEKYHVNALLDSGCTSLLARSLVFPNVYWSKADEPVTFQYANSTKGQSLYVAKGIKFTLGNKDYTGDFCLLATCFDDCRRNYRT